MTNDTHVTIQKTLWSDTLTELLVMALEKQLSDDHILNLLKEMKEKKFEASYITSKIRKELDEKAAMRVKSLMRQV